MVLKRATYNLLRLFIRVTPLIIAALLIAAQTLVAFHGVAHANKNTLATNVDCADVQAALNSVSASTSVSDAETKIWNALFGHAADGSDNAAACVAWDAAFAAATILDDASAPPASIVYSVTSPSPLTPLPVLADLLGIVLARAPPQA